MSRKKGYTAKLHAEADSTKEKISRAAYGDAYNDETKSAFEIADRFHKTAFEFDVWSNPEKFPDVKVDRAKEDFNRDIIEAGEMFINEIARAVDNRDATFFKNLVVALEAIPKMWRDGHASPERVALLLHGQSNFLYKFSRPLTTAELCEVIREHTGKQLDDRQVKRLCKELGIEKRKQSGRPKKVTIKAR